MLSGRPPRISHGRLKETLQIKAKPGLTENIVIWAEAAAGEHSTNIVLLCFTMVLLCFYYVLTTFPYYIFVNALGIRLRGLGPRRGLEARILRNCVVSQAFEGFELVPSQQCSKM